MRVLLIIFATLTFLLPPIASAQAPRKIVLIGGKSTMPARTVLPMLGAQMRATPVFAGCEIWLYPTGWPEDPNAIEGASAVLLYENRGDFRSSPVDRTTLVLKLLAEGTGVIALHPDFAHHSGLAWLSTRLTAPEGRAAPFE